MADFDNLDNLKTLICYKIAFKTIWYPLPIYNGTVKVRWWLWYLPSSFASSIDGATG